MKTRRFPMMLWPLVLICHAATLSDGAEAVPYEITEERKLVIDDWATLTLPDPQLDWFLGQDVKTEELSVKAFICTDEKESINISVTLFQFANEVVLGREFLEGMNESFLKQIQAKGYTVGTIEFKEIKEHGAKFFKVPLLDPDKNEFTFEGYLYPKTKSSFLTIQSFHEGPRNDLFEKTIKQLTLAKPSPGPTEEAN